MPVAVVFVVAPSPKSQNRLVMLPVDVSEKETSSGADPFVGEAVKPADSATVPVTLMRLVCVFVLTPAGPLTISLTVFVPAEA